MISTTCNKWNEFSREPADASAARSGSDGPTTVYQQTRGSAFSSSRRLLLPIKASGLGSRRWFRRFVRFRRLVWLRLLRRLGLLRCLWWLGRFRRLDGDQFDFEYQCAVGRNWTAAGLSVSKVRRNKKLPLGTGGH